ncbi:MAG: hypothetical protein K2I22_14995 [Lachnospiraceae bacterium]|nr:hypothetical protein [Lachnospiraceae bacterium]
MTREEMRMKRELKKAIEKDFLKPISKSHGYKIIGGTSYCVRDNWLYTISASNSYNAVRMIICVKPVVIDEIFWTVFEMKEEASKKPFSFHVNAAFVPWSFWLEEWRIPITAVEETELVLEQAFTDTDEKIAAYCKQIRTIQDFKELVQSHEPVNHLNCILCDIALGNIEGALAKTEEELSNKHSGGFASTQGGDIYKYIQRYCKSQL